MHKLDFTKSPYAVRDGCCMQVRRRSKQHGGSLTWII